MIETTGNLWAYPAQVVCITTNGFVKANGTCVMGRGCAREARDRFRGIDKHLGDLIKRHGNRPMKLQQFQRDPEDSGTWIVSFPTKHVWADKSDPALIVDSATKLVAMADKFNWTSVVLPRPGCGNGGLDWDAVRPLIESVLDDRFTVITHPVRD